MSACSPDLKALHPQAQVHGQTQLDQGVLAAAVCQILCSTPNFRRGLFDSVLHDIWVSLSAYNSIIITI